MPKYLVAWEIDSEEDTPEEAAWAALAIQRRETSSATVFKVKDKETGAVTEVDLGETIDIGSDPSP